MNFPYGTVVETPQDLVPPEMWPEFGGLGALPPICAKEEVGVAPQGARWRLWPLCFEEYFSDNIPDLQESKKGRLASTRIVKWLRVHPVEYPKGWLTFSQHPWRIDGFYDFRQSTEYMHAWNKNVRRELRIWKEKFLDVSYSIERVSIEEFTAAYKKSTVAKQVGTFMLAALRRKYGMRSAQKNIEFLAVRNKQSRVIVAGMAVQHSPTYKSSMQECPFILPEGQKVYAMTALIAYWFQISQERKDVFLLMTHFWHRGESKSWKGFSEFKSHFGLQYVAYPPMLWRIVVGKLW